MGTGSLIVIVGPTGSGKTALSIALAQKFNGEIVCADSRTVYRGMDVGTAKPSAVECRTVPHHLLDVVEPDQPFTVADFKHSAEAAILDIQNRGKLPLLVGGSGLYIDAVLFDYQFSPPETPRDQQNPRHAHRDAPRLRQPLRVNTLILGLSVERAVLKERIRRRVEAMVSGGLIDEVKKLTRLYPNCKALLAPGYRAFQQYLDGSLSLDEAKARFVQNDMNLAKRQMTWFKRNKSIHWFHDPRDAVELVTTFLNKNP